MLANSTTRNAKEVTWDQSIVLNNKCLVVTPQLTTTSQRSEQMKMEGKRWDKGSPPTCQLHAHANFDDRQLSTIT